jgi:hypothetical protein
VIVVVFVLVLVAVVIAFGFVFGGPLLGAILAGAAIIGAVVWFMALAGSKTTTSEVVRETHEQEFLGPGGPDDPRA